MNEQKPDAGSGHEAARAAGEAEEQGLLFTDDVSPLPSDLGYRGPTACNAAGITYRQLDYWARTGLIEPTVRGATGSGSQRLYSFRDILILKVIKRLLDAGISLQQIRTAVSHLRERGTDDLTRVTLMSDGASVYECTSNDEVIDLLQGGQGVFGIAIGGVWREIEGTLAELPSERTTTRRPRRPRATSWPRGARPEVPERHRRRHPTRSRSLTRRKHGDGSTLDRLVVPTIPRGRVFARQRRRDEAPKGQFLPGTSQAPGPRGPGNSEAPSGVTEGEANRSTDQRSLRCRTTPRLAELDAAMPFVDRHIGLRPDDVATMLERLGFDSLDELMAAAVPGGIRSADELDLPGPLTEEATARELRALAAANRPGEAMIGLGYHATITPPVIRRNVLEDPSWYTAYTPYQPEISQGRLEALLNFQTMVGDLTGLPTANASLLDEATAAAEAMTLVRRAKKQAVRPVRRRRRRAAADHRRGPHPGRGDGHRGASSPTSPTACRRATCAACWSSTPAPPGGSSTRARSSTPPTSAARSRSSPPTCSR